MSFTPIRERDAGGALIRSGFEWSERRDSTFIPFLSGLLISVLPFLYGIFLIVADKPLGYPVLIGSAFFMWLCWRGIRHGTSLPRSLVFGADGAIDSPRGLPDFPKLRRWEMQHADIVSIEAKMNMGNSTVELFKHGGGRELLAQKLTVDEARLVAVQLTTALNEMRAAIGGAHKTLASQIVID